MIGYDDLGGFIASRFSLASQQMKISAVLLDSSKNDLLAWIGKVCYNDPQSMQRAIKIWHDRVLADERLCEAAKMYG